MGALRVCGATVWKMRNFTLCLSFFLQKFHTNNLFTSKSHCVWSSRITFQRRVNFSVFLTVSCRVLLNLSLFYLKPLWMDWTFYPRVNPPPHWIHPKLQCSKSKRAFQNCWKWKFWLLTIQFWLIFDCQKYKHFNFVQFERKSDIGNFAHFLEAK